MNENNPPPAEQFSDAERLFEYSASDASMQPDLRTLCDAANNASYPQTSAQELQELINQLSAHVDIGDIHFINIQSKITSLRALLSLYHPSPLPEGDYEAL